MTLFLLLFALIAQAGLYVDPTCEDTVRAWRGFRIRNEVEAPRVAPGSRPAFPSHEVSGGHVQAGGNLFVSDGFLARDVLLMLSDDLRFVLKHEVPGIQRLWASAGKVVVIARADSGARVLVIDGESGALERDLTIEATLRNVWEPLPGQLVLVLAETGRLPAGPPQVVESGVSSDLLDCDRILYTRRSESKGMTLFVPIPLDDSALTGSGVVHGNDSPRLFGDTVIFSHDRQMHELRWMAGAIHLVRSFPISVGTRPEALIGEHVYSIRQVHEEGDSPYREQVRIGVEEWGSEGRLREFFFETRARLVIRGRFGLEMSVMQSEHGLGYRRPVNIRQLDLAEMSLVGEFTVPKPHFIQERAIYFEDDALHWFDLGSPGEVKHLENAGVQRTAASDGRRLLLQNRDGTSQLLYRYDSDDFCRIERDGGAEITLLDGGGLFSKDRDYPRTVARYDDDCNLLASRDESEVLRAPRVQRRSELLGFPREYRGPFWLGGLLALLVMGVGVGVFGRRERSAPDLPLPVSAHDLPGLLHGDQWVRFNARPMRRIVGLRPFFLPPVAVAFWVATSVWSDELLIAAMLLGVAVVASSSWYRFNRAGSPGRAALVFAPVAHLTSVAAVGLDLRTCFTMLFQLAVVLWTALFVRSLGNALYSVLVTVDIEADHEGVRWWRNVLWTRVGVIKEVASGRVDLSWDGARWVLDLDGTLLSVDHPSAGDLRWLSDEANVRSPGADAVAVTPSRVPKKAFFEALPLLGGLGFAVFVFIVEPHSRTMASWMACCLAISAVAIIVSAPPTRVPR